MLKINFQGLIIISEKKQYTFLYKMVYFWMADVEKIIRKATVKQELKCKLNTWNACSYK